MKKNTVTMNPLEEPLVSVENCILLEKVDFNEPCPNGIRVEGPGNIYNMSQGIIKYLNHNPDPKKVNCIYTVLSGKQWVGNKVTGSFARPTQAMVCLWLRHYYNLNISIKSSTVAMNGNFKDWIGEINCAQVIDPRDGYDTYEDAMDETINIALKQVLKNG